MTHRAHGKTKHEQARHLRHTPHNTTYFKPNTNHLVCSRRPQGPPWRHHPLPSPAGCPAGPWPPPPRPPSCLGPLPPPRAPLPGAAHPSGKETNTRLPIEPLDLAFNCCLFMSTRKTEIHACTSCTYRQLLHQYTSISIPICICNSCEPHNHSLRQLYI